MSGKVEELQKEMATVQSENYHLKETNHELGCMIVRHRKDIRESMRTMLSRTRRISMRRSTGLVLGSDGWA